MKHKKWMKLPGLYRIQLLLLLQLQVRLDVFDVL